MSDQGSEYLGFSLSDIVKMAVYVAGVLIFMVKADQRIVFLEKLSIQQSEVNRSILDFMKNSDSFHSATLGTLFSGGKPSNDRFKFKDKTIKEMTVED